MVINEVLSDRSGVKMGIKNVIKKSFTTALSPKRWVGTEQIKENAGAIKGMVKNLLSTKNRAEAVQKETFQEAMQRLNLTEEDIKKRIKNGEYIVLFCLILSLAIVAYMIYLFVYGQIVSGIVCLMLSFVVGTYAFREHFNVFQMKKRRLGCSIREWIQYTFKRG